MTDNSTQHTNLDNFIKSSLKEAEVPLDMSGWAKMEQRLDTAPGKGSAINKKLIVGSVISGVAIIGTLLVYSFWPASTDKELIPEPVTNEEAAPIITPQSPAITSVQEEKNIPENSETSLPVAIEPEQEPITETREIKEVKEEKATKEKPEITDTKRPDREEKIEETKIENKEVPAEEEIPAPGTNFIDVFDKLKLKKDKVPTFGDMIEPTKGFTKKTEEEERLLKEAEKKVKEGTPFHKPDSIRSTDTTGTNN